MKPHDHNHIERLIDAKQTYAAMTKAINQARWSIHWANFCFERGRVGRRFYEPLAAAARRGVAVRLLVDAYGSADLSAPTRDRLRAAGIEVVVFQPLQITRPWRYNHRLHKKLLVVDDAVGFTGGVGVGDYWLDPSDYPSSWRDSHFIVTGPVVAAMQQSFAHSWNRFGPPLPPANSRPTQPARSRQSNLKIVAVDSWPQRRHPTAAAKTLVALIDNARREINLTSAYFGPSRAVRSALRRAASRRVRVRIITNGPYCTHPVARDAGRHQYRRLLRTGVRIYEYQPTKIHAKIVTVDGRISYIGSANLNLRSLRHDEEFNLAVRDRRLADQLDRDFEQDLTQAHEIKRENWRRPPATRLRHAGASLGRYLF